MLQLARLLAILLLTVSGALAQAPSPAQMGITPSTTPEILQTQDNTGTWVPMGAVNSTAHSFSAFNANGIDVRSIGMKPGGQDNSSFVAALMNAATPSGSEASGIDVFFPAVPGQIYTDYYFSKPFHVTRHMNIRCQGKVNGGGDSSTRLVFSDGVHGLVFDNAATAPDGSTYGGGGISGCGIVDASRYAGALTSGSAIITGVGLSAGWPITGATFSLQAGDGVIVYPGATPLNGAPAVAAGAFLSAADSTTGTITLASPYTSNYTRSNSDNPIWRLPAADAFTVQTTTGSPTVTVTAGPSLLMPGDYVWSDAFPFGTPVLSATGTLGAQTLTMGIYHLDNNSTTNATVTHTSGSPGKMWIIPVAIKTHVETSLRNNYISDFPIGLEMECSTWATPAAGCTASMAQENFFTEMIIGRLTVGDNTGASTSIANVYANNSMTDIAELGSVGSVYIGENANSAEHATSIYGVIGLCNAANFTSYIGGYMASLSTSGYCANGFGVATSTGGTNMFIGPQVAVPPGVPTVSDGRFNGPWDFGSSGTIKNFMCFGGDYAIAFVINDSGNCASSGWVFRYSTNLGPGVWAWTWFGNLGGFPMTMTQGAAGLYSGYTAGNLAMINFPQGFLLYDTETGGGNTSGSERLVDGGTAIPSGTFHKKGDIHFNQSAAVGSPVGWVDTANGANFVPFGVISSFSGTKTAGSCVFTIVNGIITNVTGC